MAAKKSAKFGLRKIIVAAVLLALIIVLVPVIYIFVMMLSMFDGDCSENSHQVALVRSLAQEQLADLNTRVLELSEEYEKKEYPHTVLTSDREPLIPEDLKYLDARYISFEFGDPYIVLAKCDFSEAVLLSFDQSRDGQDTITLRWDVPTRESPAGSEILWTNPAQPSPQTE